MRLDLEALATVFQNCTGDVVEFSQGGLPGQKSLFGASAVPRAQSPGRPEMPAAPRPSLLESIADEDAKKPKPLPGQGEFAFDEQESEQPVQSQPSAEDAWRNAYSAPWKHTKGQFHEIATAARIERGKLSGLPPHPRDLDLSRDEHDRWHSQAMRHAIKSGEDIHAHVLAEYPEHQSQSFSREADAEDVAAFVNDIRERCEAERHARYVQFSRAAPPAAPQSFSRSLDEIGPVEFSAWTEDADTNQE